MCTVFSVTNEGSIIVAKSHDNFISGGMIFTNRRGMHKRSLVMPDVKEFRWESNYGSLTFSQCGKGVPSGGMNEKGLVVEQATLPGTLYPAADDRPEVSCLEAIQYILDTCVDIGEAVDSFSRFRISRNSWTLHYFLRDAGGRSAILEFIDGEMKVWRDSEISAPVLTNTAWEKSVETRNLPGLWPADDYGRNSMERFSRACVALAEMKISGAGGCISLLEAVKRNDTVWRCVYDISEMAVSFNSVHNGSVRKISFEELDFSESGKSFLYDLETAGDDFMFQPYSREMNRKNIEGFFGNGVIVSVMQLPDSAFIINALDDHIDSIENDR